MKAERTNQVMQVMRGVSVPLRGSGDESAPMLVFFGGVAFEFQSPCGEVVMKEH